jgi:hypothetical protein
MDGYGKFLKLYPMSVRPVEKNLYIVSDKSPIDFKTISDILKGSDIPYEIANATAQDLQGWQSVLQFDEQLFDHNSGAAYFEKSLGKLIQFEVTVTDVMQVGPKVHHVQTNHGHHQYDYVIDCTYNSLELAQKQISCFYEPCLTFLYK